MSIAPRIEAHLSRVGVNYDLIQHPESHTSLASARLANVPASQMAKAVITHDGDNYRLCVIPATHQLVPELLDQHMGKGSHYRLVNENELKSLFDDCEEGAIPALGQVYGLPVVWDKSLEALPSIYFESGDHHNLVHVNHGSFMQLMGLQENDIISCPTEFYEQRTHIVQ